MPEELVFIFRILDRCLLENPFLWPLDEDCCDRSCTNKTDWAGCCWHANNVGFYFTACLRDGTHPVVSLTCAMSSTPSLFISHFLVNVTPKHAFTTKIWCFSVAKNSNYVVSPTTTSFLVKVTPKKCIKTTTLSVQWVQMSACVCGSLWKHVKKCASYPMKSNSVVCHGIWEKWWWVLLKLGNVGNTITIDKRITLHWIS